MKLLLIILMLLFTVSFVYADSATDTVRVIIRQLPGPDYYLDEHGRWVPAGEYEGSRDTGLVVTFGKAEVVYDDNFKEKEGE